MEIKVNTSIPISFEKIDDYVVDKRFTKVRVWICHTNENLNGSYFEKKVIESMIPSLSNIPILGYISADNFDTSDFRGHEQRLVVQDGDISIEYLGRAYGLIPETNNASFEIKMCEDNIEREFLVCDGILWNKFQESIDIFDRDSVKSQSMELLPDTIKGKFGKDKLFYFTEAQFEGACILGNGIIPAMTGSVIEKFTYTDIKNEIKEMINEYKQFSEKKSLQQIELDANNSVVAEVTKEGGITKVPDNILALLVKFGLTEAQLLEKSIVFSDFSIEELEVKLTETFQKEEVVVEPVVEALIDATFEEVVEALIDATFEAEVVTEIVELVTDATFNAVAETEVIESVVEVFTLTSEELSAKLQEKESELNLKFEAEKESLNNASQLAFEKVQSDFAELQQKYAELESKLASFELELSEREKQERLNAELEIFESFSVELTEDEMKKVKEIASTMSLEEITEKLFSIAGRKKVNFSIKDDSKTQLRFNLPTETSKKKDSDKPYADLFD
jgi:hypothetical protein